MTNQGGIHGLEDMEQEKKNLKYLSHVLRNGTANIEGCMREIEKELKRMVEAVKAYKEDLDDD